MAIRLPRFIRGTRPSADDLNRLAEAVESLLTVKTGGGISARFGLDGLVLALTGRQRERVFWVKVLAVHISTPPPPGLQPFPSQITYDVQAIDRGWTKNGMTPAYGRPVRADQCRVFPQREGSLALVLRNPQADGSVLAELYILDEVTDKAPCSLRSR